MPADLFFTVNGLRLHLADWGGPSDTPPILLVHGLASNAKIWNYVAPLLARHYRVAALDQRSHGQSDEAADGDYGFAAVCEDLHAVRAGLKLNRPVLVGHSWGASVALEYAARYPESVRGVVLIDGGFMTLGKRMTWPEAEERLAPPKLIGTPVEAFRERVKGFTGDRYSDDLFNIILGNFEVRPDNTIAPHLAFENHMKIVRAMWEEDPEAVYPKVHCPALFLPCIPPGPHDEMTKEFMHARREGSELAQKLMPQARVEWLADSIHDVPLQRPELVAEKIRTFVEGTR
jgi:pimeloyl-ACP methyl ester carboxylesterase